MTSAHIDTDSPNALHELATLAGGILEQRFPAVPFPDAGLDHPQAIPHQHVEELAEEITLIVAQIIQSWLDAGSERDVTLEELTEPIAEHLKGWSDHPDNAPR